jgi:peptide/nickel transport system substrate-binding protein
LAVPLALALVAASCGDDDDDDASEDTTATETTESESGSETDTTEAESGSGGGEVAEGDVDTSVVENTDEITYGGDLVVALEAEATGLRPWEDACGEPCANIMLTIYDTLMAQTAEGSFEPYLAESLEPNDDFTVWTMTLRPDVTFSNGTPLTAQTIADMFPIQQAGTTASAQVASQFLQAVEATGELEVTYTLSQPNSAFPSALTGVTLGMPFDPAAATADPDGYNSNPIGTGPYTVQVRDLDNETIVVRRDDYWFTTADGNQLPYLDSINFRPVADEGSRLDSLLSGTVDVAETRRQATIRDARAESGYTLYEFQGNNVGGGMFNTAVPPFDDRRVRYGLNQMNDQNSVIAALGGEGISLPGTQWFSPDDPNWTQEAADTYPAFDFEAGTASIAEYVNDPARSDGKAPGDPIDVELSCPPDPTLIAAMQVLQQVWSGSGLVNVNLTQFDQATHINNAVNDEHRAHCWRWGTQADPGSALAPFVAPPEVSVSNFPNFNSPTMQEAISAANMTDDFEERRALFSQVMQEINNEAILWYSGHTATAIVTEENVKGLASWEMPDGTLGIGVPGAITRYSQAFISE